MFAPPCLRIEGTCRTLTWRTPHSCVQTPSVGGEKRTQLAIYLTFLLTNLCWHLGFQHFCDQSFDHVADQFVDIRLTMFWNIA